jgi:hypothetical protein
MIFTSAFAGWVSAHLAGSVCPSPSFFPFPAALVTATKEISFYFKNRPL